MTFRSRRVGALVLMGIALPLAACASTSGTIRAVGEPLPVDERSDGGDRRDRPTGGRLSVASLRDAASQTTEAPSGRFEMTMRMSEPSVAGEFTIRTAGAFSGGNSQIATTMDLPSGAAEELPAGLGDVGAALDSEMIVIGQDAYFRGGMLATMFGGGSDTEEWVKLSGGSSDPVGEGADSFGGGFAQVSPSALAELLDGAYGEVETLGVEDVRGVAATHHRVLLDPAEIVGSDALAFGRDDEAPLGEFGELALDVWIDGDGLVRRFRFAPNVGGAVMEMTADFYDLGAPVSIEPPAAFREIDPSKMFGGVEGLGELDLSEIFGEGY